MERNARIDLSGPVLHKLQSWVSTASISDDDTLRTMKNLWVENGYCPLLFCVCFFFVHDECFVTSATRAIGTHAREAGRAQHCFFIYLRALSLSRPRSWAFAL